MESSNQQCLTKISELLKEKTKWKLAMDTMSDNLKGEEHNSFDYYRALERKPQAELG